MDDHRGLFTRGLGSGDLPTGHHAGDRGRGGNGLALFINDEAAVRIAVESEADVAPCLTTAAWRSRRFSGSKGLAGWLGNEPSSSK